MKKTKLKHIFLQEGLPGAIMGIGVPSKEDVFKELCQGLTIAELEVTEFVFLRSHHREKQNETYKQIFECLRNELSERSVNSSISKLEQMKDTVYYISCMLGCISHRVG